MTKADMIDQLKDLTGFKKVEVEKFLDAQEALVNGAVAAGGEVTIPGIVKISVVEKAERIGRNVKTGESITIKAHKAPKLKALKSLKEAAHA
jgi:DNA-binding protein HU-beta